MAGGELIAPGMGSSVTANPITWENLDGRQVEGGSSWRNVTGTLEVGRKERPEELWD